MKYSKEPCDEFPVLNYIKNCFYNEILITFRFLQSELRDIFYSSTIHHPMQPKELKHKKHSIKFKDDKILYFENKQRK